MSSLLHRSGSFYVRTRQRRATRASSGATVLPILDVGLFALFVLVSLLTRWLSLVVEILDMDEAAHAVGSWVLLDGGRLYTDFVDNKPPLLYGYYALAQGILGRGLLPVHVFTAVVTVPLAALGASAAFRHDRRGVAAGLLWLVWRNVLYAANPITAAGALGRAARYLLPWLVATAPLWWAWRNARHGLDEHHRRLVDGLAVLGRLPALAGFRFFPHYFVSAVFALALGAGPAVARWWERPHQRAGRVFLASTLALAVGFAAHPVARPLGLADGRPRANRGHVHPGHGTCRPVPLESLPVARLPPARPVRRRRLRAHRRCLPGPRLPAARLCRSLIHCFAAPPLSFLWLRRSRARRGEPGRRDWPLPPEARV